MPSITLTTSAAKAQRLAAAVGDAKGLTVSGENTPRSATAAEIEDWFATQAVNLVLSYEDRKNREAIQAPTPIDFTTQTT